MTECWPVTAEAAWRGAPSTGNLESLHTVCAGDREREDRVGWPMQLPTVTTPGASMLNYRARGHPGHHPDPGCQSRQHNVMLYR